MRHSSTRLLKPVLELVAETHHHFAETNQFNSIRLENKSCRVLALTYAVKYDMTLYISLQPNIYIIVQNSIRN